MKKLGSLLVIIGIGLAIISFLLAEDQIPVAGTVSWKYRLQKMTIYLYETEEFIPIQWDAPEGGFEPTHKGKITSDFKPIAELSPRKVFMPLTTAWIICTAIVCTGIAIKKVK
jgi:hypothetical protein